MLWGVAATMVRPEGTIPKALRGAAYGLVFGIAASILAVAELKWRGAQWMADHSIRVGAVVAFYAATGVTCGAIAGGLREYATTRMRAALLGAVVALPPALAVWWYMAVPQARTTIGAIEFVLLFAGLTGGPFGWSLYGVRERARRRNAGRPVVGD